MQEYEIYEDKKELFICSMISSMYHMAIIDGKYDVAERRYIANTIKKYPEYFDSIKKVTERFESSIMKEEYIVHLLRQCKEHFNKQQRKALIESSIRVLAADGVIHKKEKTLVKTYLFTLGLDPDLADEMISDEIHQV